MQYKTAEVAARCKSLTRVNIYKNRVKLSTVLPLLPNREALQVQLMPSYFTLGSIGRDKARSRPLYSITDDQRHAAEEFLRVSPLTGADVLTKDCCQDALMREEPICGQRFRLGGHCTACLSKVLCEGRKGSFLHVAVPEVRMLAIWGSRMGVPLMLVQLKTQGIGWHSAMHCALMQHMVPEGCAVIVQILQEHLWRMCAELHQYTITDVQTSERVSLLLKESFVESFNARDRLFMKQFVETQMFSVYCDAVMK